MKVSLIICTRERPAFLARTLQGVGWLHYPDFELIVIADPRDAETASCIARHAPRARVGACATANLAMARNAGLAMARGEVLVFLDDDAVPEPDWLDHLVAEYADPTVSAAGGFIRARNGMRFQSKVVLIDEFGGDHHARRVPARLRPGWFVALTGTNFSARRDAALAIGGFDENYEYFLEETDFLRRLPGRIAVAPAAEVHHVQAAGALRDAHGVPRSLEVIARSKAYYGAINRRPETPAAAEVRAVRKFTAQKNTRLRAHRRAGRINAAEQEALSAGMAAGLRDGAVRAAAGRRLARLTPDGGAFVPYPKPGGPRQQSLCVLAAKLPLAAMEWRALRALAGPDAAITLIGPAPKLRSSVAFEMGAWRHEISPLRVACRGGLALALAAEVRRVSAHRRFDAVHIMAASLALERAAALSGLPRFSPNVPVVLPARQ